ncbi:transposase [Roseomonas sp. BN140053]|uniref:transposase n=1 Tax=Roseomonas sp. BN140053 TaxID=3391898 RepID=UPI0039EC93A0
MGFHSVKRNVPVLFDSGLCTLRGGRKGGAHRQGLGRSRGGFSTKIHLRANAYGLPIGLTLTPGEAHDSTAYAGLMDERDSDPGILLADRGYDSDAIRQDVRDRGGQPEIPPRLDRGRDAELRL